MASLEEIVCPSSPCKRADEEVATWLSVTTNPDTVFYGNGCRRLTRKQFIPQLVYVYKDDSGRY